jgi:hypothetical protein
MRGVIKIEEIDHRIVICGQSLYPKRYWVSRIVGKCKKFGFKREFLKPDGIDYKKSNSKTTRGIFRFYWITPGYIYEVSSPQSWRGTNRYFCRTENGNIIKMTREEVIQWIK